MASRIHVEPAASRMLCIHCSYVGEPETLLGGSDVLELIGWCCLALPGLLYCAWRHSQRLKACHLCGSTALMRQTRAAAARNGPQAAAESRVRSLGFFPVTWPRRLATPRARMRRGALPGLLSAGALAVAASGGVEWGSASASPVTVALVHFGWCTFHAAGFVRPRPSCAAWDETGRDLRIEHA